MAAKTAMIAGDPSSGKSTSIQNLNPDSTYVITLLGKELPFPGWEKKYMTKEQIEAKDLKGKKTPNLYHANTAVGVKDVFVKLNQAKHIKVVVVDDGTYSMANDYMNRLNEDKWDKWKDMASAVYFMIQEARNMRDDLIIFFIWHTERDADGNRKAATLGKLFDSKLMGLEPFFTLVLYTWVDPFQPVPSKKFFFQTQTVGKDTARAPIGMFDRILIPNDLKLVAERIVKHANGEHLPLNEEATIEDFKRITSLDSLI